MIFAIFKHFHFSVVSKKKKIIFRFLFVLEFTRIPQISPAAGNNNYSMVLRYMTLSFIFMSQNDGKSHEYFIVFFGEGGRGGGKFSNFCNNFDFIHQRLKITQTSRLNEWNTPLQIHRSATDN